MWSMPTTLWIFLACHQRMSGMVAMRRANVEVVQTEMLEVFREVARQRSITGAAATLRYTQSAVSRQMAALEAEFGARLFDRLPRGVALTAEGHCLLEHASAVLDRLASARRDVQAVRDAETGRLRVGAFATADAAVVPRALARFRASHPHVEISLVEGLTTRLLSALLVGDADVVLVNASADRPFTDERFRLHHLVDEPMLLAVSASHALARPASRSLPRDAGDGGLGPRADAPASGAEGAGPDRISPALADGADFAEPSPTSGALVHGAEGVVPDPTSWWMSDMSSIDGEIGRRSVADSRPGAGGRVVRLRDLAGEAWVAGSARAEETLLGASVRLGFRPRIEFVVREWTAKFGFVAAGLGVTLVPGLAARTAPADVVLLPLDPAEVPPRTVVAATLAGRTVPPVVEAFLGTLREEVTEAARPSA
ncbi:LysR substrate-binding domain-containing protein [Dactylosporangium sp. NPDC049140]|uniref:LysR family transcriptional regulator n=1 Tax=Dactylosporangium sp. NPDC049140 TaxID=3155647 RepID=UPI0033E996E6